MSQGIFHWRGRESPPRWWRQGAGEWRAGRAGGPRLWRRMKCGVSARSRHWTRIWAPRGGRGQRTLIRSTILKLSSKLAKSYKRTKLIKTYTHLGFHGPQGAPRIQELFDHTGCCYPFVQGKIHCHLIFNNTTNLGILIQLVTTISSFMSCVAKKGLWRNSFSLTTEWDLNVTNLTPSTEYTITPSWVAEPVSRALAQTDLSSQPAQSGQMLNIHVFNHCDWKCWENIFFSWKAEQ